MTNHQCVTKKVWVIKFGKFSHRKRLKHHPRRGPPGPVAGWRCVVEGVVEVVWKERCAVWGCVAGCGGVWCFTFSVSLDAFA